MSSLKREGATSFKKGNNMLMKEMDNAKGHATLILFYFCTFNSRIIININWSFIEI
jgi:hypothetical protein